MILAEARFHHFFARLQETAGVALQHEMHTLGIRIIHGVDFAVNIIYYLSPCEQRIRLSDTEKREIHVDEDLWVSRPNLILNRIVSLAGHAQRVYARETVLARIDKGLSLSFLREHHLNVPLPGKYRYGLFMHGDLVTIAVFSGGRRMRDKTADYRSFELLRFCHKQGMHVVGALSKLINGLRKDFLPGDVMTYADRDWTDGKRYKQTGFHIEGETAPQMYWVDSVTSTRYPASSLPDHIAGKTTDELHAAGYYPLWNNGSLKLRKVF